MTGVLTSMQRHIWVGQHLMGDVPLYNTTWRIDFNTEIDPSRFEVAFRSVVSRCDALRIVFAEVDGVPVMRLLEDCAGSFDVRDLGDPSELEAQIFGLAHQSFDLSKETCRSALIRVAPRHWVWVLSQHHLVNDAASGPVIFRALAEAYEALPEHPHLNPLPSFFDYAADEAARPSEADLAYWGAASASASVPAALYGQRLTGAASKGVEHNMALDGDRLARLVARASDPDFGALSPVQAQRGILQTTLFAWLARVSRTDEITIGVATHGRLTPPSRNMAGCLIDIFPLTVPLQPEDTFRALHQRIRGRSLAALRHAVPGANQRAQGVDAILNAFSLEFGPFCGTTPHVEWLVNIHTDPTHPVRLNVIDAGDGAVSLRFLFNQEILRGTTAERAVSHYLALLDAILDDPDQLMDHVALAQPGEQSYALVAAPAQTAKEEPNVLRGFANWVEEDPDQPVILDGTASMSRKALDDKANAVAQALADLNLGSNALVGVHLRRTANLVATLLGVLKSGHAFVPLDPGQASQRLDTIAEEARLSALVTEKELARDWSTLVPQIDVGTLPQSAAPLPQVNGRAAYVLFTSGTTGRPKGVVVGHPALSRYAHWANRTFAEDRPATWALHSSIGFDLTLTSIFAPLVSGGQIRVYRDPVETANLSVLDVFAEDACDVVKLTPRHLALALQEGRPVSRIRALVLGGEGLAAALARDAKRVLGEQVEIFNEYGPTEATIGCMVHRFDPDADTDSTVPIGRPAEATRIYVLDTGLNPVPDGVTGALYIGGPDRLASGYLHRPEETDAVFVEDPFQPGERMYRSGDLASVCGDGTLLYHGRDDDQIKLGGVRMERAEIAAAVLAVPGISDCAVIQAGPHSFPETFCKTCGMSSRTPEAEIDEDGVCRLCKDFAQVEAAAQSYFLDMDDLHDQVKKAAAHTTSPYDCIMLLSGGKDSTYALCRLAELTPRILCLTLDNGYISETAKTNITRVTDALGLDHRFMTTPAMNRIFVDSLKRHANVCNGCFKTVYTMALRTARDDGIPLIVTGLSRGQLFETRLTSELFGDAKSSASDIDRMVLEARRSYHQFPDEASKSLNGDLFNTGDVLSEVEIVDFYRYCDVPVSELYRYLKERIGWTRPQDTGRSSNCLINDVGIYVHKAQRRYHNYALPYSWDVRMGHKSVDEARAELDDDIDETRVTAILEEIGYDHPISAPDDDALDLVCYYVGADTTPAAFRSALRQRLPREALPVHFVRLDKIPLNANGKVDTGALPAPKFQAATPLLPPTQGDKATRLLAIFRHFLGVPDLARGDNFYDVGGTSITALQIAARASAEGMKISAIDIFTAQSVDKLEVALKSRGAEMAPKSARVDIAARDKQRIAAMLGKRRGG